MAPGGIQDLILKKSMHKGNSGEWQDARSSREECQAMTYGQPGQPSGRNCVACGRQISNDANVCPYCGHDFRTVMAGPSAGTGKKTFQGSLAVLIILVVLCWPAGLIYYFIKRE